MSVFLGEAAARLDLTPDPAERVVEAFTLCVRTAQRHPWVSRSVRTDPGQLLELLRSGEPSPLQLGRAFVAQRLRQDHPAAAGADERLAELLIRLSVAYAVLPNDVVDFDDAEQLRSFATEMVVPIVADREN